MLPRKVLLPPDPLHKPSSVITFFQDKVGFFFPVTLLSYASWLVTITGMNHQCTALSGSWQNICQPLITLHQVIRQSTMQTNACDCSKGSDEGKTEGMSFTHGDKLWEFFMYKVEGWMDANQKVLLQKADDMLEKHSNTGLKLCGQGRQVWKCRTEGQMWSSHDSYYRNGVIFIMLVLILWYQL
jgi:hypothetical protein